MAFNKYRQHAARSALISNVRRSRFMLSAGAWCLVLGMGNLHADAPAWSGDPDTTQQAYLFTTDSTIPTPNTIDNPFGSPLALVSVVEPFGTGWQDPAVATDISGVDSDGAWDIGPGGTIAVAVPFAEPLTDPGLYYRAEVHVYVVAFQGIVELPVLSASGVTLENVSSSTTVVGSELLGQYIGITWTAEADVPVGTSITLVLEAGAIGAVIDSVEIHTRYTIEGVPQHTYENWVSANFPGETDPAIIGFDAVLGCGVPNGMKYWLGLGREQARPPIVARSYDAGAFVFNHTRNKTRTPDATGSYEWTTDLAPGSTWHQDGETADGRTVNFGTEVVDDGGTDFDEIDATATVTGTPTEKLFVRINVTHLTD